jgi:hypothetical protein
MQEIFYSYKKYCFFRYKKQFLLGPLAKRALILAERTIVETAILFYYEPNIIKQKNNQDISNPAREIIFQYKKNQGGGEKTRSNK